MINQSAKQAKLEEQVINLAKYPYKPKLIVRDYDDDYVCPLNHSKKEFADNINKQYQEAVALLKDAKVPYWFVGCTHGLKSLERIHVVLDFGYLRYHGVDDIKDFIRGWQNKSLPCELAFNPANRRKCKFIYEENS